MGKNTDKLYITHSEWASSDAFSASAGSAAGRGKAPNGATFKRLPYNFCALTLQPFSHPVCTTNGTIFELTAILPWLKKHNTNPVDGTPLKASELIKLTLAKNEEGEYVDPVTFKQFTDNTHIIALRNTGNVFAYETIERLNVKAKNWRDLVSDIEFTRKDIITIQDPQNLQSRDLSSFKYIQEGTSTLTDEERAARADPTNNLNLNAMGSSAKVLKAREAVARARAERASGTSKPTSPLTTPSSTSTLSKPKPPTITKPTLPTNAANHTTGLAAASFTSTGVTPHTLATRATLTNEDFLLKPRRVKNKGYVRLSTTHGDLALELNTEHAPRAVWNFIQLSKKGYYDDVPFHRSIKNFMLQGGDPTGTGKGGTSIWGQPFPDEFAQSPLHHDSRGVLSMANKGKNTNTSQFFITYRSAGHLDRKHTVFGKVIPEDGESAETLRRLEDVETDEGDRPRGSVGIRSVFVFVDPFEEFMAQQEREERAKKEEEEGGGREDDVVTWTGKRVGGVGMQGGKEDEGVGVGRYLDVAAAAVGMQGQEDERVEVVEEEWEAEPPAKKRKAGGFGDFSGW